MGELDEAIRAWICENCHVALYYDHPNNPRYKKCVLCGHCKLKVPITKCQTKELQDPVLNIGDDPQVFPEKVDSSAEE